MPLEPAYHSPLLLPADKMKDQYKLVRNGVIHYRYLTVIHKIPSALSNEEREKILDGVLKYLQLTKKDVFY